MNNARKVLVVAEDLAIQKSFEQALYGKGYVVTTASSGEEALWELDKGKYDLVFTAMAMRGISGLDVAEEMHARQPGPPVVIMTGHGSEAAEERAAAAGIAQFLHAPVSPEQLVDTAERMLQTTKSPTALQAQTPAVDVAPAQATTRPGSRLKDIVLFLLAPFVGIFYILAFPVIGLGMLAIMILSSDEQNPEQAKLLHAASPKLRALKTIAKMFITAVLGIGYAFVAPILGIGVLIWFSFQAWGKLGAKVMKS